MLKSTDDLRITEIKPLTTPIEVMRQHPRTDAATRTVIAARHDFHNILTGQDDRFCRDVSARRIEAGQRAGDVVRHFRLLVDRATQPLDGACQSARQPGRVNDGRVARPERGQRTFNPDALGGLLGIEILDLIFQPELLVALEPVLDRRELMLALGDAQ